MKNKKAQMKIQQTAFMLVAVTLFFVLIGLVVLAFSLSGLRNTATLLEEQNAMLLVSKLSNSPEFACGDSFGTRKINCVDADKVLVLKNRINNYRRFWGVENIEIRKIYPPSESEILCTSSNYPSCNIIRLISNEATGNFVGTFVSLCRKEASEGEQGNYYDKCELAQLMVSYEKQ